MSYLKIGAIYDKNLVLKTDEKSISRIGAIVKFTHLIEAGRRFTMQYIEKQGKPYNHPFTTSTVEKVEEDDGGVWITTKNTIYRFDNCEYGKCKCSNVGELFFNRTKQIYLCKHCKLIG